MTTPLYFWGVGATVIGSVVVVGAFSTPRCDQQKHYSGVRRGSGVMWCWLRYYSGVRRGSGKGNVVLVTSLQLCASRRWCNGCHLEAICLFSVSAWVEGLLMWCVCAAVANWRAITVVCVEEVARVIRCWLRCYSGVRRKNAINAHIQAQTYNMSTFRSLSEPNISR